MPFYWHCCGCCCIFFLVCFLLQAKRDICQLCEKSSQFFAKFVNNHRKIHWISKQKKKITRIINECSQCELHINHRNNNFDEIKKNCKKNLRFSQMLANARTQSQLRSIVKQNLKLERGIFLQRSSMFLLLVLQLRSVFYLFSWFNFFFLLFDNSSMPQSETVQYAYTLLHVATPQNDALKFLLALAPVKTSTMIHE